MWGSSLNEVIPAINIQPFKLSSWANVSVIEFYGSSEKTINIIRAELVGELIVTHDIQFCTPETIITTHTDIDINVLIPST